MAKGKKGKSDRKKKTLSKYPPPVILKSWPGKITDQELEQRHQKILQETHDDYILIRITQVDWKFHNFFMMINIKAPLLSLQNIISQVQHQGAVLPSDIIIYKSIQNRSIYDLYQPNDCLILSGDITRFSRETSQWPIGQPIFLNYQSHPKDINYLTIHYDVLPFMDSVVQSSIAKNIWKDGIFNNSLVMVLNQTTKKSLPAKNSMPLNAALDFRRVSMMKTKNN